MSKYIEIILPILFALIMSLVKSFKAGRTKIVNIVSELLCSFLCGWLGYYILTDWYHIGYNVVCGFCGIIGYISPQLVKGIELMTVTAIDKYNEKLKS